MAIEDILSRLPKLFGTTPEVYRGLLDPAEAAALENRANIGGLLGFAGALAQGMSPQGYRRSAAQNILTALGAGYGAAGQTYESGLNQVSNVMKLAQAKRQISGLAAMKKANPDLAYLADVSPDEFVRQVSMRERAKMYGLAPTAAPSAAPVVPSNVPSVAPAVVEPPVAEPVGLMATDGGGFVGGGYGSVGTAPVQPPTQAAPVSPAPVSVTPSIVPSANVVKNVPFFAGVSPENKAEAARLRRNAAIAAMQNDVGVADFLKAEADRLDPKEQIFFRDGKAFSTARGLIADVSGNRVLNPNEAVDMGLDPKLGKWAVKDGIPTLIPNTGISKEDQRQALIAGLTNQLAGVYPTLRNQADALIARAGAMDNTDIVKETERILGENSKILAELNPALQTAAKTKAPKVEIYTGALSQPNVNKVQEGVLTDAAAITRLNNIQFSYKPEYQNIQYRGKQAWNTLADKVFRDKLPESEKRQLTEYSQYKQNSLQNLNQTIKDLTGAAMGVQEADRIITSLPNAGTGIFDGDSPTEFEAKLNNAVQQTKYSLMRKNYALKNGLKWENIALEKMPSIIQERGKQIEKQYKLDPKDPATKPTVLRQLSAEFGVPF